MGRFIEDYATGLAEIDDIDDYVDAWHEQPDSAPSVTLYDYLGLTREQYKAWAENPDALEPLIKHLRSKSCPN